MPLWKPWDHAIDLKDMFKLKKGHIIPLSPSEQEEVVVCLDNQSKKGYILYALLNLSKCHQCSSFPRKMGRNGWYRITAT